ncbi:cupin domain-containing protein [Clostridium sp.]|uniref:cupin domain-containing protein n=1 Tax=Clostridium sp. TaxID=1506 RepID=UPI00263512D3|nr:cupin domain-containing protein [Clostridium sp.]
MDRNINLIETSIEQYNDMVPPKIPIFKGQDIITEVYFLTAGQSIKKHKHPEEEKIFIVLKGSGIIIIEDKNYDVNEGSTVYINKGQWHQVLNGKKNKMTIYQIIKKDYKTEY